MTMWVDQAIACLESGLDLILVTVAEVRGSAPRETSAKMLVAADQQWLTIGGGNLEWQALYKARAYLTQVASQTVITESDSSLVVNKNPVWFDVFQLGPSLGQCCGGVVGLLFEGLNATDLPWLRWLQSKLLAQITIVKKVVLQLAGTATASPVITYDCNGGPAPAGSTGTKFEVTADRLTFTEFIKLPELNIIVFGAGHVGQALVRILATLPCKISWVDNRSEQFPANIPAHVQLEDTDIPEAVIDQAPAGSCYVVMTHDHALDQRICEHILRRDDAAYFGLIGSITKRRKFEHRFKAKGISPGRYAKMVCPIGIPAIKGKQPAVIAVAVAAELMSMQSAKGFTHAHKSVSQSSSKQ